MNIQQCATENMGWLVLNTLNKMQPSKTKKEVLHQAPKMMPQKIKGKSKVPRSFAAAQHDKEITWKEMNETPFHPPPPLPQ